jgi:hypothetical protein
MKLANKTWQAYLKKLHAQNPGVRLRTVRSLYAVCPKCGTQYNYRDIERTFVVVDPAPTIA